VTDPIASIPLEALVTGISAMLFTDEEIAEWIRNHELTASDRTKLIQAVVGLKGPPLTGIIRTALREKDGLPPIPGDET
jgi:hypothetical protein